MRLLELITALPTYHPAAALPDIPITAITADSRQVQAGTLFVAYRGVSVDGHAFIPHAVKQGAAAIICEEPTDLAPAIIVPDGRAALAYLSAAWHGFPARKLTMVGITGTDGKTTTTNLLYQIVRATPHRVSMVSTVNAVIGEQLHETGLHTTTPDAPAVQQFLRQMVQAHTEICLLEVTSHGLAHHRVTACDFDVAVVTNITHEHLDAHGGSLADYWTAKASLFESLATAHVKTQPKLAVLNCDDDSFEYLKARLTVPWVGYSVQNHPQATYIATAINYQADHTHFVGRKLSEPATELAIQSHLVGDYNVSNCMAAIATAWHMGISPQAIQHGIAQLRGISGRMERIHEGQPFLAMVDFAHTPNSLKRTLQVARTLTAGRVIAIFGCAGLRDVAKRVMMGEIAAEFADITMITAEDPRTEDLASIIEETAAVMRAHGAVEGETLYCIPDRGAAIYRATQLARPDDVVLALGKGHEQSMCFGETEYPWDDREALRAALRGEALRTLPTATW